jgi:hypothetical protein
MDSPSRFAASRSLRYSSFVSRCRNIMSRRSALGFVGLPIFMAYLLSYEKSGLSSPMFGNEFLKVFRVKAQRTTLRQTDTRQFPARYFSPHGDLGNGQEF